MTYKPSADAVRALAYSAGAEYETAIHFDADPEDVYLRFLDLIDTIGWLKLDDIDVISSMDKPFDYFHLGGIGIYGKRGVLARDVKGVKETPTEKLGAGIVGSRLRVLPGGFDEDRDGDPLQDDAA